MRAFSNPMVLVGSFMILVVIVAAVFAPLLAPYDPKERVRVTLDTIYARPSAEHLLGTDDAGKDVLTNLLYGARVSLVVGFFASLISVVMGGVLGMLSGYAGGRLDAGVSGFTNIVLVIPSLPLAIVLVALLGPSLLNIILVIGLLGWTGTARLVRSQTLSVKERKFVLRSKALGAGHVHVLRRHILPHILPLVVANTVLVISIAILEESTLSFLGLSDPTQLSWGQMLNYAFTRGAMSSGAWWALVAPGFGIVWLVLGCTLLGNGLEHVLNPRLESHHLVNNRGMIEPSEATAEATPRLASRQPSRHQVGET
jgi:peptide/nickel transport system permease protein